MQRWEKKLETWTQIQKRHKEEKIILMQSWATFYSSIGIHQAKAAILLDINHRVLCQFLKRNNIKWHAKYGAKNCSTKRLQ